jgi:hypothetical protein
MFPVLFAYLNKNKKKKENKTSSVRLGQIAWQQYNSYMLVSVDRCAVVSESVG